MLANRYTGIVESTIERLIVSRARRLRIAADEIDDLQQKIVPMLAEFQFDEARSNGATPRTVMTAMIDRQLKAHLRAKRRYDDRIERVRQTSRSQAGISATWPNRVSTSDPVDLKLDLENATAALSERDRRICHGLSRGETQKSIAERLGIGRDTVARAILRIRAAFTAAGLQAWIDPDYQPRAANA